MTKYLTTLQLAERFGLSQGTIRKLANENIIPSFRPSGGKIIFPLNAVIEFEESQLSLKKEKKEKPKRKVLSIQQKRIRRID